MGPDSQGVIFLQPFGFGQTGFTSNPDTQTGRHTKGFLHREKR